MNAKQRRAVRRQMDGKRDAWLEKQKKTGGLVRRIVSLFKKG